MIGLSTVNRESKSRSRQTVRVLRAGLQLEQVNHVDEADLQVREILRAAAR